MINCRLATQEDSKEIVNLLAQLSPLSEEDQNMTDQDRIKIITNIIEDKNHYLFVAEDDGQLAGTGLLLIQLNLSHGGRPYAHIENVVVEENLRRKGIGKEIVLEMLKKAKQENCYKVILDCKIKNAPFYKKCGLKETGEIEMRIDP
jgi:glucosamine-phosphate N-acetyltransferase